MATTARAIDGTLLAGLWIAAIAISQSALFASNPDVMGLAITLDITLTASAIHWFVGIKQGKLPSWTLSLVLLVGALIGAAFVPGQGVVVLALAALTELAIAGVALVRLRKISEGYRKRRDVGDAHIDALEHGLAEALESTALAHAVRLEVEIAGFSVFGWFMKAPTTPAFTHHRNVGWVPMVAALVGLSFVEGGMLHYGLDYAGWPTVAIGVSLLHVYGVFWLIGDAHALRLRPTVITRTHLRLNVGLRWSCAIPRVHILSVEPCTTADEADLDLSVLGAPNIRIRLRQPVTVRGLFGIVRHTDQIVLQLDDVGGFLDGCLTSDR